MQITKTQIHAVYDMLELDHDLTLALTITPTRVHVSTPQLDTDGHPIVSGGALQITETSHDVEEAPDDAA